MTLSTHSKLSEFERLQPGWHYGQGIPPSAASMEQALNILEVYLGSGIKETDAFCGQYGEVMVTAYHGDDYIECDIEADGTARFTYRSGKTTILEGEGIRALFELSLLVRNAAVQICGTIGH